MRRRLLRFLGTKIFRYAWGVIPVLVALTAAAVWMAMRMDFDTSLIAFLPSGSQPARVVGEMISDYRNLEPNVVVIRAKQPGMETDLKGIAQELAAGLNNPRMFTAPVYKVDELAQQYYESLSDINLVKLMTLDDWDELERLMTGRISEEKLRRWMGYRLNAFLPKSIKRDVSNIPFEDPLGAFEAIRDRMADSRGPTRLPTRDGYFVSHDGRSVAILLYSILSPENGRHAQQIFRYLKENRRWFLNRHSAWQDSVEIEFFGPHVDAGRQLEAMQDDLGIIIKISIPLLLLLIILVFRKIEAVVFILLPALVGASWTLGLATVFFGGISALTASFLLVVVALGLQYSVHLYHRFTIELYAHKNYYRALRISYVETGRGILASAVVVAILFLLLMLTSLLGVERWQDVFGLLRDTKGLAHLGLVAGVAILCNLAACLLLLPAMAAVKSKLAGGRVKPVELYQFNLQRIYTPVLGNPRIALGVVLMLTVFLGMHARNIDFSPGFTTLRAFFNPPSWSEKLPQAEAFPRPGRPIIAVVKGRTQQEALEKNDRLYANLRAISGQFNILSYDSLRTVLPSIRSQKESLERLNQLDLTPFRKEIRSVSRKVGFSSQVYKPFIEALENFKNSADTKEYITYTAHRGEAFIATVQRYSTRKPDGYTIATPVYPHVDGFNPYQVAQLQRRLSAGLDQVLLIGDPMIERELSRLIKYNLAVMILCSVIVIAVALMLHFRGWRLALLTFVPVLLQIIWMAGGMELCSLSMHYFTLLVWPLILGMSMGNALQVAQYYQDRQPCKVRRVMEAVGRVPLLNCLMIALLFGTLSVASSPGLRQFGMAVLIGTLMIFVGTCVLEPALLRLFGQGQPWLASIFADQAVSREQDRPVADGWRPDHNIQDDDE